MRDDATISCADIGIMLTTPPCTALLLCGVLTSILLPALAAPPTADDLVIAFPVDEPHLPLAYASRSWRKVCVILQE